ncbi:MAG: hypothetical protein LBC44_01560 [Mycoplasmataceae bacterium]|nr:hypothetical protein [Mycoplasmataceae bacterium]
METKKYKSSLLPIGIVFSVLGFLILGLATLELVAYPGFTGQDILSVLFGSKDSVYKNILELYKEYIDANDSLYIAIIAGIFFIVWLNFFFLTLATRSGKLKKTFSAITFIFSILVIIPNQLVYESILSIFIAPNLPVLEKGMVAAAFGYGLTGTICSIFGIIGNILLIVYVVKKTKFDALNSVETEKTVKTVKTVVRTPIVAQTPTPVVAPAPQVQPVANTQQPVAATINVSVPQQIPVVSQVNQTPTPTMQVPVQPTTSAQPVYVQQPQPVIQSVAPVQPVAQPVYAQQPQPVNQSVVPVQPAPVQPIYVQPQPVVQTTAPIQPVPVVIHQVKKKRRKPKKKVVNTEVNVGTQKSNNGSPEPIRINLHSDGTATVDMPEQTIPRQTPPPQIQPVAPYPQQFVQYPQQFVQYPQQMVPQPGNPYYTAPYSPVAPQQPVPQVVETQQQVLPTNPKPKKRKRKVTTNPVQKSREPLVITLQQENEIDLEEKMSKQK